MPQRTEVRQERSAGFLQPGRGKPGAGAPQSCVPCRLRDGSLGVTPPCQDQDGWAVTILLPPLLPSPLESHPTDTGHPGAAARSVPARAGSGRRVLQG